MSAIIRQFVLLATAALLVPAPATAGEVKAAVAANFADAMNELVPAFTEATGHEVLPVFGSTGKHYAQIVNGAPFALFLAADIERPRRLEEAGLAVAGSRFTYAVGRLALWSRDGGLVDEEGSVLARGGFHRLAIANPELAPYGRAAMEAIEALGLRERLEPKLVRGETIAQAFQYVRTGNARLGFVALSQLRRPGDPPGGSSWVLPRRLHRPIEQQAVLLRDDAAARAFLDFLRGAEARAIIERYGYTAESDTTETDEP